MQTCLEVTGVRCKRVVRRCVVATNSEAKEELPVLDDSAYESVLSTDWHPFYDSRGVLLGVPKEHLSSLQHASSSFDHESMRSSDSEA